MVLAWARLDNGSAPGWCLEAAAESRAELDSAAPRALVVPAGGALAAAVDPAAAPHGQSSAAQVVDARPQLVAAAGGPWCDAASRRRLCEHCVPDVASFLIATRSLSALILSFPARRCLLAAFSETFISLYSSLSA